MDSYGEWDARWLNTCVGSRSTVIESEHESCDLDAGTTSINKMKMVAPLCWSQSFIIWTRPWHPSIIKMMAGLPMMLNGLDFP
jgi:hypothetical protein